MESRYRLPGREATHAIHQRIQLEIYKGHSLVNRTFARTSDLQGMERPTLREGHRSRDQTKRPDIGRTSMPRGSGRGMRKFVTLASVLFTVIATNAGAGEEKLDVVRDQELVDLISTLDHVATSDGLPFRVKIFKSYERGECQGEPRSCPRTKLFISVSTFDEAPDVRVYVAPKAINWSFDQWGSAPAGDSPTDMIVFSFEREVVAPDPARSWVQEGKGQVRAESLEGDVRRHGRVERCDCDAETGLHYSRFRYYSPELGRFISAEGVDQVARGTPGHTRDTHFGRRKLALFQAVRSLTGGFESRPPRHIPQTTRPFGRFGGVGFG